MDKRILCLFWNIQSKQERAVVEIFEHNPDLVFLAEVENPQRGNVDSLMKDRGYQCIKWVGDKETKGLACYAKPEIVDESSYCNEGKYCISVKLKDRKESIVGVWTIKEGSIGYIEQMKRIFDHYIDKETCPIFIGDFNVSAAVQDQGKKAIALFDSFDEKGYGSLYHLKNDVAIGQEKDVTHLHTSKKYFMLDYILCPKMIADSLAMKASFEDAVIWLKEGHSDHIPIMLQI